MGEPMTRRLRMLGLCAMVLLVGCQTVKPEKVETNVYRHGFDAVQITKIPPDWTGAGKEIVTQCEWAHMAKSPVDQKYYCPGKALIQDAQASHRHPLIITGSYKDVVIPAAGEAAQGAFMGLGIGLGLANQRVPQGGTSFMSGGNISTFVTCGAGTTFTGAGKAPGCN